MRIFLKLIFHDFYLTIHIWNFSGKFGLNSWTLSLPLVICPVSKKLKNAFLPPWLIQTGKQIKLHNSLKDTKFLTFGLAVKKNWSFMAFPNLLRWKNRPEVCIIIILSFYFRLLIWLQLISTVAIWNNYLQFFSVFDCELHSHGPKTVKKYNFLLMKWILTSRVLTWKRINGHFSRTFIMLSKHEL